MRQIRLGVFETNSSSTHSIAIPDKVDNRIQSLDLYFGDFGWSFREVNACEYLYTAIYDIYDKEEADKKIKQLRKILERNGISCGHFEEPVYDGKWFESGYVDHGYELTDMINDLFANEDLLIRYINGARVFTGNDNSDEDGFIERNEPTYREYNYNTGEETIVENPYYMGEGYKWYFKGN